ncbi:MAG: hypothetical protein CMF11_09710 [Idiomarina sp.]|nr:hypothetical protein [Idiomarina sp.]
MARRYDTVTYIKLFPNTEGKGKAQYSNSKWMPYDAEKKGYADITFREGQRHQVSLFPNDDGTISIRISRVTEYEGEDSIADGISQPALKPIGNTISSKYSAPQPKAEDDDPDIPF